MSAVLVAARAGASAPAGVRLTYQRAPGVELCPDEGLLRDEVTRQLGYDPVDDGAADRLSAMIFRGPGREVHATMELTDPAGAVTWARHLVADNDDCRELVLNMALSIRIALDPSLRPQPAPDADPPAAPLEEPPVPPLSQRSPLPAPRRAVERPGVPGRLLSWPELRAGLGGGMSIGMLPAASGGPSLVGTLRFRQLSFGVEGRVELPITIDFPRGERITAWLAAATLVTCARTGVAFGYVFGCGFVSFGMLMSSGSGVTLTSDPVSLVAASGPRAGVELPLTDRLAAQLHGDLALRLSRTDVAFGGKRLWTSPEFAGLVGVDLVLTLSPSRRTARAGLSRTAP